MEDMSTSGLIPANSQAVRLLANSLLTNDTMLSFAWAWWRAGKRLAAPDSASPYSKLFSGEDTPLKSLCRFCFEEGQRGQTWPVTLGYWSGLAPLGSARDSSPPPQHHDQEHRRQAPARTTQKPVTTPEDAAGSEHTQ